MSKIAQGSQIERGAAMTVIEILADAVGTVCVARDTLAQNEKALRGIQPPCSEKNLPYGFTSEDAADFIYSARDELDNAAKALNHLIKAAEAGRLNGDKDKEVR